MELTGKVAAIAAMVIAHVELKPERLGFGDELLVVSYVVQRLRS